MSLSANAIVTMDEARDFVKKTDDQDIGVLEMIIKGVQAIFDRFTDRTLEQTTYTAVKFDGSGWADFWLPAKPITTLTSVYENDVLLVVDTDYYAYLTEGRLRRIASLDSEVGDISGQWTTRSQGIKVSYVAGYAAATWPWDLKHAALIQVADHWQKFLHKSWGEMSRSVASQSVTVQVGDLLDVVKSTLQRYRRIKG